MLNPLLLVGVSLFLQKAICSICLFIFSGICGGSASGKTTVANKIIESLGHPWVTLLSMDSFYKVLFCGLCLSAKKHLIIIIYFV